MKLLRLYRNSLWEEVYCHAGFTWHATKAEAIASFEADLQLGVTEAPGEGMSKVAEEFDVSPTKAGIIEFLNKVASYNDNG